MGSFSMAGREQDPWAPNDMGAIKRRPKKGKGRVRETVTSRSVEGQRRPPHRHIQTLVRAGKDEEKAQAGDRPGKTSSRRRNRPKEAYRRPLSGVGPHH